MLKPLLLLCLIGAAVAIAACGDSDSSDSTAADSSTSSTSLADCTPDTLDTLKSGTLTIGTDKPAFPPYFEDNDPTNGKGFESATAYAIADQLGFSSDQVEWTVVPFNSSYAPGPKDFDFDINQISITPKRAEQVDFSSPYYTADQAVVALKGSDAAAATSLADLQDAQFGVQIGTTSLDAVNEVIQPSSDPQVFDTSNDVVSALKQDQVDAVVVDTPTALYLTAVQVPDGTIVGEFPAPGGDEWGALLAKDSPLTDCVSAAVDELRSSGELDKIQEQWINSAGGVSKLQ
ncbi:MAG TPA: ABC transporter substrate-binding protein [Solirubrobacterales bacterium]|jgi:polar amino acid transport system substrate-binding protein|nr:ABC transporter substrate-binding protein [Solirubrobacterales bacterium]